MNALQALLLGIVQGLTEFLPVSSDGHLTLVPFFFGWDSPTLAFDVAVHIGTLAAAVYVFRGEVARLIRTAVSWKSATDMDRLLLKLIVVGNIPAVIAGVLFDNAIESAAQRPVLAALMLGITGWWLFGSEARAAEREAPPRGAETLSLADTLKIGIAQATAILPGISRSGTTIGMGLRLGLDRGTAARFSFVLGIPVIFGAIVFKTPDMLDQGVGGGDGVAFLIGIVTSAVTGFYAIRLLLSLIGARTLRPFAAYCIAVMILGFIVGLARG